MKSINWRKRLGKTESGQWRAGRKYQCSQCRTILYTGVHGYLRHWGMMFCVDCGNEAKRADDGQ